MMRPVATLLPSLALALTTLGIEGAIAQSRMIDPFATLSVPEGFQGIVIEGPAEVSFQKRAVGRALWDHSQEPAFAYFGNLSIHGTAQIHTSEGKQHETWFAFERRLSFVVKDLTTNTIQRSSRVDGGWNSARMGLSVQMAPSPTLAMSEEDFNKAMPAGKLVAKHFIYQLDDHLPKLYAQPTTLEIHAEHLGFRSNTIRVKVHVTAE